ncbi:PAS domain S-box-containing protein/diguanylate cyclase (GGDEF) domain-containing protein [Paraburkholderia diazotrophica]|uniref:PAS domain S-box-containing protein/diguanylate cyclase (GGDEF) domain-containing protein n=2 Tax=Paraburkholderia diazotrophica TaxID=667676 RepID=A0A1H7CBV8_9BURK|nr:PAS domain S-box-containing protein/diguanylate cyclase (GGDEF) domain-containing protein [Paraburkholderia diazotrophica]
MTTSLPLKSRRNAAKVSRQDQHFLALVLDAWSSRRAVGPVSFAISVATGIGAGTAGVALQMALRWPAVPLGVQVGIGATAGVLAMIATRQRFAAQKARQAAAMALASSFLDASRDCVKLLDLQGHMLRINDYGATLMEASSPRELQGADWLGFWKGDDHDAAMAAFKSALGGTAASFRGSCTTTAGQPKWWDSQLIPVKDHGGKVIAVVCASLDISNQTRLLAELRTKSELMSEMEAHVQLVFFSYSANFEYFHYITAGSSNVFGIDREELLRNPNGWLDLVVPEDRVALQAEMRRVMAESTEGRAQYRIRKADGTVHWLRSTGYPVLDDNGNVLRIVGITEDVTAEQERIAELDRLAYTDSLTGLANRAALLREIESRCAARKPFGLMFVDLDRFKVLNDTLGHLAADHLLRDVGGVIRRSLPDDAYVARLGGDEFAVLIGSVVDKAGLEALAQALLGSLSANRLQGGGAGAFITASIGISVYPEHGSGHDALLSSADVAMYTAKQTGRNGYQFAGEEAARTIGDFELERDVPEALATNQFFLHFQTIHEPHSLAVHSAEALIRWQHPARGLISPSDFIPLLEETGFVSDVGVWVLDHALRQLAAWRQAGAMNLGISVNVSARQLGNEQIVRDVDRALKQHGIPPGKLEIELTETALMKNPQQAQKSIVELKRLGVRIAIDDFGTGYSSLMYLADFAPHTVKIDRHFTSKIEHDPTTQTIVEGIIGLAHKLGIKVIAEGVENAAQLAILRRVNCDYVQGFLLSEPQAPEGLMTQRA